MVQFLNHAAVLSWAQNQLCILINEKVSNRSVTIHTQLHNKFDVKFYQSSLSPHIPLSFRTHLAYSKTGITITGSNVSQEGP